MARQDLVQEWTDDALEALNEFRFHIEWAVDVYLSNGFRVGDGTPEGYAYTVAAAYAAQVDSAWAERKAARKPKLSAPVSPVMRGRVLQRDADTCQHCGATEDLAIDHIVPESRGGKATLENLQVLCRRCNSSKGNR